MTAPTDQFVEITKRSQEAITTAVRNWSDALNTWTGTFTANPKLPDSQAIIDQYFDFMQQVLDNQRNFAHTVLTAGTQAAESVTEQAQRVAENVKAQALQATEAATEQATRASQATARTTKTTAAKN